MELCISSRDPAAWEEFIQRFDAVTWATATRIARKCGITSPEVIRDLVQDTYLKLCANSCKLLRDFTPSHPEALFGFVKTVTANIVYDHCKAVTAQKRGSGATEVSLDAVERHARRQPDTEDLDRDLLIGEIDTWLRGHLSGRTAVRDRQIFWLYYRHGLTARAIAAIPEFRLTAKAIESILLRITRNLRSHLGKDRGSIGEGKSTTRPRAGFG